MNSIDLPTGALGDGGTLASSEKRVDNRHNGCSALESNVGTFRPLSGNMRSRMSSQYRPRHWMPTAME